MDGGEKRAPVKVVIGVPTYGDNKSAFTLSLLGFFGHCNPDIISLRLVPCAGSNIAENQNALADKAEEMGADYLLLMETDMIAPRDAVARLLAHGKDIVGACYPFKDAELLARIFRGEEGARLRYMGHKLGGDPLTLEDLTEGEALIAMDFVPMGLTLISAKALRAVRAGMRERFPPPEGMEDKAAPVFYHALAYAKDHPRALVSTTDSSFGAMARAVGLDVWCDAALSLAVEHVGDAHYGLVSAGAARS